MGTSPPLTYAEAADRLSLSYRQIVRMVADGTLPVLEVGIRARRIPVDGLERYVREHTHRRSGAARPTRGRKPRGQAIARLEKPADVWDDTDPLP